MSNALELYWPEKYRPETLDDCLIDGTFRNRLGRSIADRNVPHMLLSGPPGISKTTVARCIANDMGAECLFISGSLEGRNIDTVRTTIIDFAMATSMTGAPKIVLIDEADRLNRESVQPALRTLMEDTSDTVRFILTCNEPNRIVDAIKSRCYQIDMSSVTSSKPVKLACIKRVFSILDTEGVNYDKKSIIAFVDQTFPDIRQIITRLQQAASQSEREIGPEILVRSGDTAALVGLVSGKKFTELRAWAETNAGTDVYGILQDSLVSAVDSEKDMAQLVLILADYSHRAGQCMDQKINLSACLFEIAMKVKFR